MAGHFLRIKDPWSKSNLAHEHPVSVAIAVLIIVRHHKNIGRIFQGTEPKVPLRRTRGKHKERAARCSPSGWIQPMLLAGLAVLTVVGSGQRSLLASHHARSSDRGHRRPVDPARDTSRADRPAAVHPGALRRGGPEARGHVPAVQQGLALRCAPARPASKLISRDRPARAGPWRWRRPASTWSFSSDPPGDDKHLGPGWWESVPLRRLPLRPHGFRRATIPTTWPSRPTAGFCSC